MKKELIINYMKYSFILSCIFIFPDIVFLLFYPDYFHYSSRFLKEYFGILIISFMIQTIYNQKIKIFFFLLFAFFSFIELAHYTFFHGLLMHYEITFFFTQFQEVVDSATGILGYMIIPFAIFVIEVLLGFYVLNKSIFLQTYHIKYMPLLMILLLLIAPISAHKRHNISSMMPSNKSLSLINTYKAVSLFLGKEMPKYIFSNHKLKLFKTYEVIDSNITSPRTIILVMGESLGYKHMHLFGADSNTTPGLDTFRHDTSFFYKKAYAGAVDTLVAVPTFFLMKREPENVQLLSGSTTNLFHLAKQHGYRVSYFTTQKLNILESYIQDVDDVKHLSGKDEALLNELNKIDFSKKNFIILHQRNSHSPYENYTPPKYYKYPFQDKDYHTYMVNTYYNSILYTDSILTKLIKVVQNLSNSLLLITSDHSEMMGLPEENGRYGHTFLSKEVAKVPIIIYDNSIDKKIIAKIQDRECFNHYILGKILAYSFGYTINNPNENGEYYIQGARAIDGSNGFIQYNKEECAMLNKEEK